MSHKYNSQDQSTEEAILTVSKRDLAKTPRPPRKEYREDGQGCKHPAADQSDNSNIGRIPRFQAEHDAPMSGNTEVSSDKRERLMDDQNQYRVIEQQDQTYRGKRTRRQYNERTLSQRPKQVKVSASETAQAVLNMSYNILQAQGCEQLMQNSRPAAAEPLPRSNRFTGQPARHIVENKVFFKSTGTIEPDHIGIFTHVSVRSDHGIDR